MNLNYNKNINFITLHDLNIYCPILYRRSSSLAFFVHYPWNIILWATIHQP
jgi:hypothetical protein